MKYANITKSKKKKLQLVLPHELIMSVKNVERQEHDYGKRLIFPPKQEI